MITVLGEALVDLLVSPDGSVEAALGGAPFNTARAASRLGAEVEFVGALSTDRFGDRLLGRLVVLAKRALRPLVKTPQQDLWDRQRIFNLIVIEELKARCLKETGLEPPRQPEFQSWATKMLDLEPKKPKARKRKTTRRKSKSKAA